MDEQPLTLWTIRIALVCYVAVLAGRIAGRRSRTWRTIDRWIWTAGCLLLAAHIASAFHFYHAWSHAHAVADTARQTRELIGWEFGGGVYFNYLFAALWTFDVGWMWIAAESYQRRPTSIALLLHAYMFFIAANGAIVFESGPTRWFGIAACIGLAAVVVRRMISQTGNETATELPEGSDDRVSGE